MIIFLLLLLIRLVPTATHGNLDQLADDPPGQRVDPHDPLAEFVLPRTGGASQAAEIISRPEGADQVGDLLDLLTKVVDHDAVVRLDRLVQTLQLEQAASLRGKLSLLPLKLGPLASILPEQELRFLLQPAP